MHNYCARNFVTLEVIKDRERNMVELKLDNETPFNCGLVVQTDEGGKEILVVVLKGTYQIKTDGTLVCADEQVPIISEPIYFGDTAQSSLKYVPDINFTKVATDVALIGHAIAPAEGEPITELTVTFQVGEVSKTVCVFGDRSWTRSRGLFGKRWFKSKPKAFKKTPLTYEYAFGGKDDSPGTEEQNVYELRNPIGTGVIAKASKKDQVHLPNVENPEDLIKSPGDKPLPAGFGFVAPDWQLRQRYAGTYDEQWQKNRMPLLPKNFDRKFFNAAHPDLIADGFLKGDERVHVTNTVPEGELSFNLPGKQVGIQLYWKDGRTENLQVNVDSIVVDTDEMSLQLLWRASIAIDNKAKDIEIVKVNSLDVVRQEVSV